MGGGGGSQGLGFVALGGDFFDDTLLGFQRRHRNLQAVEKLFRDPLVTGRARKEKAGVVAQGLEPQQRVEILGVQARRVSEAHSAKVDALREQLSDAYEEQKREALNDYPVFMAIAEDIGYDATGRETKTNELEPIAKELARFIKEIEAEDVA